MSSADGAAGGITGGCGSQRGELGDVVFLGGVGFEVSFFWEISVVFVVIICICCCGGCGGCCCCCCCRCFSLGNVEFFVVESFEGNLGFDWSFEGKITSVRFFFGSYLDEW